MINYKENISAYIGTEIPISSVNVDGTGQMLYERVNFTVQNSITLISVKNGSLDGAGTLASVIVGNSNGTMIKRITIKARETTQQGMIRLFIYDGSSTMLWREVEVPATTQSSRDDSFEAILDEIFYLEEDFILKAATEENDEFVIFTESVNVAFP